MTDEPTTAAGQAWLNMLRSFFGEMEEMTAARLTTRCRRFSPSKPRPTIRRSERCC